MKIGIFFGSTTGHTEEAANRIAQEFNGQSVDVHDVGKCSIDDFNNYDVLILGVPTWNIGEMQDDWDGMLSTIKETEDFSVAGKTVAMFALGDQKGYPDTFLDAMGELWETFKKTGPRLVGIWPTESYDFSGSTALHDDDHFLGLGIDDDQEPDLTEDRIIQWVVQLKGELAIA